MPLRCLLPLCLLALAARSACAEGPRAEIDRLVEPLIKDKPAVGLVVGVYMDGKPTVYGYGKVTTAVGVVVPDGGTLFEVGSITKAFTGVLLAEAVIRKEVALDDPANRHLPADLQIKPRSDRPVTLVNLATHRGGLPRLPPLMLLFVNDWENPYAGYTRPKLARAMPLVRPSCEPGASFGYSNFGVGLLGEALVATAKAEDYDDLVRDRIGKPLGLKDTGEALTGARKARLAVGHDSQLKPTKSWDLATMQACGCLKSTADDLLRFAAANLGEIQSPLAAALKASHEKQAEAGSKGVEIGHCWFRSTPKGRDLAVWHNGATGGYCGMIAFTPATRRAVVVLCAASLEPGVDELALKTLELVQPR